MNKSNQPSPTVQTALERGQATLAAHSESARLDAELLLAVAVKKDRGWLYAHADEPLPSEARLVFEAMLAQRAEGRPIAHLTGSREFWSLEFAVNEFTLVPRPETELLVERTLARTASDRPAELLDLGTGSGAIAISIAHERPMAQISAVEQSAEALAVAKANAELHRCDRIEFFLGDWFEPLPQRQFDVIVSNPPYVSSTETELTDRELAFEPVAALYSGAEGLDALKLIIGDAPIWLKPGGWLLLEHGFGQQDAVRALLEAAGFNSIHNYKDLNGHPRVTEAQLSVVS